MLLSLATAADDPRPLPAPNVSFEVVPSKSVYKPNEEIVLKLLLTNRDETPVIVERFSQCGDTFFAFVDIKILDKQGREAQRGGCTGNTLLTKETMAKIVSEVGNSQHWVELKPGDIYGEEVIFEVRTKSGQHTVNAAFLPARFNEEQLNAIAQRNITVLSRWITAAPVSLTVR